MIALVWVHFHLLDKAPDSPRNLFGRTSWPHAAHCHACKAPCATGPCRNAARRRRVAVHQTPYIPSFICDTVLSRVSRIFLFFFSLLYPPPKRRAGAMPQAGTVRRSPGQDCRGLNNGKYKSTTWIKWKHTS